MILSAAAAAGVFRMAVDDFHRNKTIYSDISDIDLKSGVAHPRNNSFVHGIVSGYEQHLKVAQFHAVACGIKCGIAIFFLLGTIAAEFFKYRT